MHTIIWCKLAVSCNLYLHFNKIEELVFRRRKQVCFKNKLYFISLMGWQGTVKWVLKKIISLGVASYTSHIIQILKYEIMCVCVWFVAQDKNDRLAIYDHANPFLHLDLDFYYFCSISNRNKPF